MPQDNLNIKLENKVKAVLKDLLDHKALFVKFNAIDKLLVKYFIKDK